MLKRMTLAMMLLVMVGGMCGCRMIAPHLEDAGGCNAVDYRGDTKTRAILRQWARNTRGQERFIDQYFLNYDVNDPYRGDCLVGH